MFDIFLDNFIFELKNEFLKIDLVVIILKCLYE